MATTGSVTVNGVEAMLRNLGKYGEEARKLAAAAAREPIDFEAERLKRLVEKARDTRDP